MLRYVTLDIITEHGNTFILNMAVQYLKLWLLAFPKCVLIPFANVLILHDISWLSYVCFVY